MNLSTCILNSMDLNEQRDVAIISKLILLVISIYLSTPCARGQRHKIVHDHTVTILVTVAHINNNLVAMHVE